MQDREVEKIGRYSFGKMDEDSARKIAAWRYAPPYDLYNCDAEKIEEVVIWYLQPENNYYAVWDESGELVGFRCYGEDARVPGGDYELDALDLGGGLRPDLTGQGLGASFMNAALEFARRRYPSQRCRATVAKFNQRALRVCEQVGYKQTQTFTGTHTGMPFVVLIRENE